MGRLALACLALLALASTASAAQPSRTDSCYAVSASTTTPCAGVDVAVGDMVTTTIFKTGGNIRNFAMSDNGTPAGTWDAAASPTYFSPNCPAGQGIGSQCTVVYVRSPSASAETITVQAVESVSHVSYVMLVEVWHCANVCTRGAGSGNDNSSGIQHFSGLTGAIDTNTNTSISAGCTCSANLGTQGAPAGWEHDAAETSLAILSAFEDDVATAFTDERGEFSSTNNVTSVCVIFGIEDALVTRIPNGGSLLGVQN